MLVCPVCRNIRVSFGQPWDTLEPHEPCPVCNSTAGVKSPRLASTVMETWLWHWHYNLDSATIERTFGAVLDRPGEIVGGDEAERKRALAVVDWVIHSVLPAWLRLGGLTGRAAMLEATPAPGYHDMEALREAMDDLENDCRRDYDQMTYDPGADVAASRRYMEAAISAWQLTGASSALQAAGDAPAPEETAQPTSAALLAADDACGQMLRAVGLRVSIGAVRNAGKHTARAEPPSGAPAAFASTVEAHQVSAAELIERLAGFGS